MSKEHILPKWLRREFPEYTNAPTHQRTINENEGRDPHGPRVAYRRDETKNGLFNDQARVVCTGCNNGWMSQLEKRVREPLSQMIRGLPVVLTGEWQALVSLWVVKTLMVSYRGPQLGGRPTPEIILPVDPESLYRDAALGPTMVVSVSFYEPETSPGELVYAESFTRMEHEHGLYSYVASLKLGHFVAQLGRARDGVRPPLGLAPYLLPDRVALLCPGAASVNWPPAKPVYGRAGWEKHVTLPERIGY
ncbi:hypothetical protein [Streptomyces sp. NBC_00211]|uniref:hypothetical protein n=1 Tax=Streptomyces sp. NBC_00211 TaxID=2975683 RepID=UPI003243B7A5